MNERVDFLENLLDHIESISWKSLKKEVRERSIVFLADTIGVGLSAAGLPDTRRLSALSEKWGPGHSQPCLLYTSPSPRDVEESRMPSSA